MKSLKRFFARLANFATRREQDERLHEEIEEHIELQTAENLRAGLSPIEARRRAMVKFGAVEAIKEDYRDVRGLPFIETLLQDLRYALRMLRKSPGFAVVAVLTLALGIGANIALFTIVNAVLLERLPFQDAEQLVRVTADFTGQRTTDVGLSIPELFDLRRSGIFSEIAGLLPISANLTESEDTAEPERIEAMIVDANYFSMLGVGAQLGRVLDRSDWRPGISDSAVISDGLWRRRFGADPAVLGKSIRIDNDMYSIVGVAPALFRHPGRGTEMEVGVWLSAGWIGLPFSPQPVRRAYLLQGGLGRLRPGLTPQIAQARINAMVSKLRRQFPNDYPEASGWTLRAVPLHDDLVGNVRPAMVTLLAAVGFVLLIACANVASLLLARSTARQREFAIRCALGAARGRIVRQLLTESVMLAAVGGVAGLAIAILGVQGLVRLSPTDLLRLHDVHVNGVVLAFTVALSIITGIVFGVAPAIQGSSAELQHVMRESSRSTTATGAVARLRAVLVVAEFALSLVLLVGAALLVQSFWRLQRVDLGFRPQSVFTLRLWLSQPNDPTSGPYFTHQARANFYKRVLYRVAALPGVQAAGGVSALPLTGARPRNSFVIEGRSLEAGDVPAAEEALATPGYFSALGIDLVRGRLFDEDDDARVRKVAVVSEAFVRKYFPCEDPIGKRFGPGTRVLNLGGPAQPPPPEWTTIVGVVRDVRTDAVELEAAPLIYRSEWQESSRNLTLTVRADGDAAALAESIRREVRGQDPNVPVYGASTMETVVASALSQPHFTMLLLVFFAATALLLSAVGIYGLMAYYVTQRTHEIGIRVALGAGQADVLRLLIGQGARLAAVGVAIGMAGAFAVTRAIGTLLYGVSPWDPTMFAGASLLLLGVALTACYIPARRAMGVDPMVALRYE
jgi:predicted permease